jgi:hypothetical protein
MSELLDTANKIIQERAAILKKAQDCQQEMQSELEKLKAVEKAAFGVCDGEKISVADLIVMVHKVLGKHD